MKKSNFLLVICVFLNVYFYIYAYQFLSIENDIFKYGQLIQPFSIHSLDRFMDYYNVNYHALSKEFYSGDFKSVYSEIFRFISKLLTPSQCLNSVSSLELKKCSTYDFYIFYLLTIFINLYLIYKNMGNHKDKLLWTLLFGFSFPMFYCLERGNYIILTMIIINIMSLTKNNSIFEFGLLVIPFTKIYLITLYLLIFIKDINKFLLFLLLFFLINSFLFWLYDDSLAFLLLNLVNFNNDEHIYEILDATSFLPILSSYKLVYFKFLWLAVVFFLIIRMYIYINLFIACGSRNYCDILFLILLLLLIILPGVGFYSIILLYPLFCKYINSNFFSNRIKIFVALLCLPYPLDLFQYKQMVAENIMTYIQLHSLLIPLLLIFIFYEFTKKLRMHNDY